jgi:acetyltransferase EpsM
MTPQLVLVGGGEHAHVVAEAVRAQRGAFDLIGFVDPRPCAETSRRLGLLRLGDDSDFPAGAVAVLGVGALGPTSPRLAIAARLESRVAGWAVVVHPSAVVSPSAYLGPGTVVMANAVVQAGVRTGVHVVINSGAIVEHDVTLGDHVQIASAAAIGGGAQIGHASYVGLGARLRDHIRVGADVMIGMGAVVVAGVPDHTTVAGVPARPRSPR